MMATMRDAAVELAKRGFNLFTLGVGVKTPNKQGARTAEDVSNDPERVYAMWTDPTTGEPLDNNIAVDTSSFVVFDLDIKNGGQGYEQLLAAEIELGELPRTYTIRTPSGGEHLYFRIPAPVGQSPVLGKSIDIRAAGGYVLGCGSHFGGAAYEVVVDVNISDLPTAWYERLRQAPEKAAQALQIVEELDTEDNRAGARAFLASRLPAIQGQQGDRWTFVTACEVRQYGLSEPIVLELMLEEWNDRCEPPWSAPALERKVASAFKSAQQPLGASSIEAQFPAVIDIPQPPAAAPPPADEDDWIKPLGTEMDFSNIPRREWLVDNLLLRGAVSSLVAPGGSGKSTLTLMWGVAGALGNGALIGATIPKPFTTLFINNEDPHVEIWRRVAASLVHHKIPLASVGKRIFLHNGAEKFCIGVRDKQGRLVIHPDKEKLRRFVDKHGVDLIVVDPLVETHEGDENDNVEMSRVVRAYRELAEQLHIAVVLVHHSRKPPQASSAGFAESADAGRGASAVVNAVRVGLNFFPMSEQDAKDAGLRPEDKFRYARLDTVKANLFLSNGQPAWFEKVSVPIGNGESYGALVPVNLETARSLEANTYIDALVAADGNETLDAGLLLKDAADLIADNTFVEHLAGNLEEIASRLRSIFKSTRVHNGWEAFTEKDGKRVKLFVKRESQAPVDKTA